MSSPSAARPIPVVLDTNVVLDLWLFADVRTTPLRDALAAGQLQALVTEATLAELAHVLQRPFTRSWATTAEAVLTALRACSREVAPPERPHPPPPRCSDAEDQKFVDLAWSAPAAWLLSHDRAVLRLGRAAAARGLRIGTPAQWAAARHTG